MSTSSFMINISQYIQRMEYYIAMFLKISAYQNLLEGLLKHRCLCCTPRVSDSLGQGKQLKNLLRNLHFSQVAMRLILLI